ncbi:MAG: metallophosphoesterase [Paraglaciecola sp.]|nr:metallophosphoesterase [Paraglaciecola sp.]
MIRIAQISDCHLFADASKTSYGQIAPYQSLAKVLDDIALQSIDLLLVTGDLSGDGSLESYRHFEQLIKQSGIQSQWLILPGNHDDLSVLQQQFSSVNLWSHYSIAAPLTIQNWQLHLLNTKTSGTGGFLAESDLVALAQSLKQSRDYSQLIAAHHHPLVCHSWMDNHGWQNSHKLLEVIAQYDSVKAMIYGHIHAELQQQIGQCHYLACPSTCWQWALQAEFGISQQAPAYRVLNLDPTGQFTTDIKRVEYS